MNARNDRSGFVQVGIFTIGLMVYGAASVEAQPVSPFFPPQMIADTATHIQANVGIDLTRDGAPDLYSTGFFLSNFAMAINHNGSKIKHALMPFMLFPVYPPSQIPMMTGMASANIDQDPQHLIDLVGVTNSGAVFYAPNTGNPIMGASTWGVPQVVDFFGPGAVVNPPFLTYSNPVIRTGDLDGDGRKEIVTASARIDVWVGSTFPGELFVYHNQGAGNFVKHAVPIPGSTIDLELADLNRDGSIDHVAVVTENPGWTPGFYGYELTQAKFDPMQTPSLWISQPPFQLQGRATSLEIGDVMGGPFSDYVVSNITFSGALGASTIYVYEGDGLGGIVSSSWTTFSLPPNMTGLGDFVYSMRVGDFNRDGSDDIAALRSFTLAVPTIPSTQPQYANAEILIGMGPNASQSAMTSMPLSGFIVDGNSAQPAVARIPLRSVPDALQLYNFGLDKNIDLVVAPVSSIQITPSGPVGAMSVAVIRNNTPPVPLEPSVEVYGSPSGGNPTSPAVVGFDGGQPVVGNQAFGITMGNIPVGSLVGFAWGPVGMPNLYTTPEGIDAHIIPVEYSYTYLAQGVGSTGGFARQPLAIPNNPSLLGDVGYFQGAYYHSSIGFGGTSGAHVLIGQ